MLGFDPMSICRNAPYAPVGLATVMAAFLGCSAVPLVETTLHEGPRGKIALQVFPEGQVRAAHPIALEPSVLTVLLSRVYVREQKTRIESALTGKGPAIRAFAEEEVSFLTPLLSSALAQATPDEQVFFRLLHQDSPNKEFTEGSLYASDRGLHVTLTHFHFDSPQSELRERSSYGNVRHKEWTLVFVPETALLDRGGESSHSSSRTIPSSLDVSLVWLFSQMPTAAMHSSDQGISQAPHNPSPPRVSPGPSGLSEEKRETEEIQRELRHLRKSIQEQERKLDQLEKQVIPREDQTP